MEWMMLPLKRYADFQGRSRRMEYWMWFLFNILVAIGFGLLSAIAGGSAALAGGTAGAFAAGGAAAVIAVLNLIVSLAFLIPSIAVAVRRLHDTNRSGWWLGGLVLLYAVLGVVAVAALGSLGAEIKLGDPAQSNAFAGSFAVLGVLGLAILVYAISLFVFMCLDGTRGPNRFGADPKSPAGDLTSVFR